MALFETMLILVLLAVALLQLSRRLGIPYPTMLALAGVLVAALLDAAIAELGNEAGQTAADLWETYLSDRARAAEGHHPRAVGEAEHLRRLTLDSMRVQLAAIRRAGDIEDDVLRALEEELDWAELAASPPHWHQLEEA